MSTVPSPLPLPGFVDPVHGFALDLSGMRLDQGQLDALLTRQVWKKGTPPKPFCDLAHAEMLRIEAGEIKNPDEARQVTHFTDRRTYPESALFADVQIFAEGVRKGTIPGDGSRIDAVIINGIGGSALGPQLLQFAVNGPYWNELTVAQRRGYPRIYFVDNTDAAGAADALAVVCPKSTLVVTISKSGNTQETRNNTATLAQAYAAAGVDFATRAVAVTQVGSRLDEEAEKAHWLRRFPMAESIGGRTSETNIVGHVPAALAGIDFRAFVEGARQMDEQTRQADARQNPAYQLALTWYVAGHGRGDRNMVVVPYSDRLVLLARYLQQLVMESLGKERALDGRVVNQGLNVFGNKGGTDAHAYIQQLNDGRDDFFVTFVEVLKDAGGIAAEAGAAHAGQVVAAAVEVEPGLTMGDYLHAFKRGLTNALTAKGRQVVDIVLDELTPDSLGRLIALYERAVAYYAELIGVNAFNQPGVESYKSASEAVKTLHGTLRTWIASGATLPWQGRAVTVAAVLGQPEAAAEVEGILAKFAANERSFSGVKVSRTWDGAAWLYRLTRP
jgi:glucose-6-phosphate isomerase